MKFGDITVLNQVSKTKRAKHVITRKLDVYVGEKKVMEVEHHHFLSWEDFGVPTDDSLKNLTALVKVAAQYLIASEAEM